MERGCTVRSVLARSGVLAAAVLTCWFAASPALAAGPSLVTVRVEGSSQTLLSATTVPLQAAAFHPSADPVASHTCSGASAARALETATGGAWNGAYFTSFGDYEVNSILGELHPVSPADGSYWSFWVNNASANVGICQQQLDPGDQILFFPDCFGTCPAGFVSPDVLALSAPTVVQSGTPFTAGVVSYPNAGGRPEGPRRREHRRRRRERRDGRRRAGHAHAEHARVLSPDARAPPNSVRTESVICVHNGNDGNCGTPDSPRRGSSTSAPVGTNACRPRRSERDDRARPTAPTASAARVTRRHRSPASRSPRAATTATAGVPAS